MSLRATLREHLLNIWTGEPWHGSSSKKILEDITAVEAAAHPLPGAQSIWEATLHMVAWTEEATSRLGGGASKDPVRGDWPKATDTSPGAWSATTDALRAARYALLDALEKSQEEDLFMLVAKPAGQPEGRKFTRAEVVAGLVEHEVYHLGQIAMLKKALRKK